MSIPSNPSSARSSEPHTARDRVAGTDFSSAHIGVYTLSVPAEGAEEALMRLLHRCQLDGASTITAVQADGTRDASVASAGPARAG